MGVQYKQGCEYLNGVVVYWPSSLHAFDWNNTVSMSVWMVPPVAQEQDLRHAVFVSCVVND